MQEWIAQLTHELIVVDSDRSICWYDSDEFCHITFRPHQAVTEIAEIYTDRDARRQGRASALMTKLCTVADRLGAELVVNTETAEIDSMPEPAIVDWLSRYGFVVAKIGMVRRPTVED